MGKNNFQAKLREIKKITGKIILETGLHIGAGETEMHIGGTDNPVVKHPFTHEPYIPGSSLKGKVRSLLEMRSGLLPKNPDPKRPLSAEILKKDLSKEEEEVALKILKLFGASGADAEAKEAFGLGPTRASFSDCFITEDCREKARRGEIVLTEVKAENTINRITGTAVHPHFTERVPAGVEFEFSITLKIFEGDERLEEFLLEGLKLLEYDVLGGSGSRGYGRVRFKFDNSEIDQRFQAMNPFSRA
ncbi:type III-A CRISPR-associated RAMP protein Csm3 [Thermosulfurimonas marina]|uniref:CRISPR system Cms endoribonuclease Csm3 n=1 Tax=Thermosulfurimonas marina TaxID=2047767 RepID=A0A6H1WUK1_9BACT|nr:type III-A CRISPR-associated RAMP protein Csm3 [Thermosulfurimonas marina]QJA06829.1 type III-A CRISPR-associated RAMP protein Csm3 [Thermosulfurimonas marina]